MILINPPPVIEPLAITNWNYFPSASTFYVVGYEDLYPNKVDYDFNDLAVAYKLAYGLNTDGDVVAIEGTAYLLTRGPCSHDWHLAIDLPPTAVGNLSCTNFNDVNNPQVSQSSAESLQRHSGGRFDLAVFSDTRNLFPHPAGSQFFNTQKLYSAPWNLRYFFGPRAEFRLDLDVPVRLALVQQAPYDPFLRVLDTNPTVKLMEVDPTYEDSNGHRVVVLAVKHRALVAEFTNDP